MKTTKKFFPEVRERSVRMVAEQRGEHAGFAYHVGKKLVSLMSSRDAACRVKLVSRDDGQRPLPAWM